MAPRTDQQLNKLNSQRASFQIKIQNLKNCIDAEKTEPWTISEVDDLLERLIKLIDLNEENYDQMILIRDAEDDLTETETDYSSVDEELRQMKNKMMEEKRLLTTSASSASASQSNSRTMDVKLPKLDLPKFSGNFNEWESFHDLFKSAVVDNTGLSGSQKLQYLKSSLRDEAGKLVNSFQLTNDNFIEAWTLLQGRYNNKREIINAHFKRLFSQKTLHHESASDIRMLIDTTNESIRSLKVQKEPIESWSSILVYLISQKLDNETRRQWELSLPGNDFPTLDQLLSFLETRARALAAVRVPKTPHPHSSAKSGGKQASTHHAGTTGPRCGGCNGNHYINKCDKFLKLTVPERIELVRKNSLCFNCLQKGHSSSKCERGLCRTCDKKHHTLLHGGNVSPPEPVADGPSHPHPHLQAHFCSKKGHQVLLATALVDVLDSSGRPQKCRALMDQGSEASFVSENCMARLGLRRRKYQIPITGLASSNVETARGLVTLRVSSCVTPFSFSMDALVLTKVTGTLPKFEISPCGWIHTNGLDLADPTFCHPSQVDILIGSDQVAALMRSGRRQGEIGTPIAQESVLGWILSGPVSGEERQQIRVHHGQCELDTTLRKFWELEEIPSSHPHPHLTQEEMDCEHHFTTTHRRDESGRYIVELPFRTDPSVLGNSYDMAFKRWKSVERRLLKDSGLYRQYQECLQGYLDLGHMELVPEDEIDIPSAYYIPHHAVIKVSSSTTKLRVVFDASAKTTSGLSLNDILMIGPKRQDDLVPQLIGFRVHAEPMLGDIEKMYRGFGVHKKHQDYQRIVWSLHPHLHPQIYRVKVVMFGVGSAPHSAIRCVQQLADDEEPSFPMAAPVIKKKLFVDNLLTGEKNVPRALELQRQILRMMKRGGLVMRQWSAHNPALLESVPENLRETQIPFSFDADESVKALGIQWNPATDDFSFKVTLNDLKGNLTKRTLLSDIAKLFDPLGWLAPVTIEAKILMQSTWKKMIDWDEPLPIEIEQQWTRYREELPTLASIKIPRCITPSASASAKYELHGFSDASQKAYAAVVYIRLLDHDDDPKVFLLISKTKVAPIRQVSIPRLELCGTVLLAQLLKSVQQSLDLPIESIYGWTDSTIVLHWLDSHPGRWKTFVANRVSEIQSLLPHPHWRHVNGKDNPADVASRGISPSELEGHPLWWHGPQWLKSTLEFDSLSIVPIIDPDFPSAFPSAILEEKMEAVKVGHFRPSDDFLLSRFSSLCKLKRVTAWCLRFKFNSQNANNKRKGGLSAIEIQDGFLTLIKMVQEGEFHDEIQQLKKNCVVNQRSKLVTLNPFLDNGILRVGGRIRAAVINSSQKFPIILPKKSKLTDLLVSHHHIVNLHAGPQLLITSLQQQFWIFGIRNSIRIFVKKCVTCQKAMARVGTQMMADLPSSRLIPGRAFLRTGVDCAGPIRIFSRKGRGARSSKGYIVIFICFTTRAIHLELSSDLTTKSFLGALKRFVSRRGRPSHLYSDNGRNFVSADKEMRMMMKSMMSIRKDDPVAHYIADEGIQWSFNPPGAPHFGGLWEAGIKSVKYHLKRIIRNVHLTFEEMTTILTQVEACLNSRPLTPLSTDPGDLTALTPGHFLIGAPLNAVPTPDLMDQHVTGLTRWQLVSKLSQHFWKRWSNEYLTRLQQRPKWTGPRENLKIGNLVLIKPDNAINPLQWNLGRIVDVHPGADGKVRVATMKTFNGEIKRPISKLCLLPLDMS